MIPVGMETVLAISNSLVASMLVKTTMTTAIGLVAVRLLEKSRAAVRHAILVASFAVLVLMPVACIIAPAIRIGLPVKAPEQTGPNLSERIVGGTPTLAPTDPNANVGSVVPLAVGPSAATLWGTVWMTGVVCFLFPMIVGLWQVRSIRRSAVPWGDQPAALERVFDTEIAGRVEVLLHGEVKGPMTCGIFRPVILMPRDAPEWEAEDFRRATLHEFEHVRRCDWATHCLARAICVLYWFHPLVWLAWHKLALEAERCCDDAVLRRSDAGAYADQLLALAQKLSSAPKSPLLAMASRSDLKTRIRALLDDGQRRGRAGSVSVATISAAAGLVVFVMSPLRIVAAQSPTVPDWQIAAGGKMEFEVASVRESKGAFTPPNFPLDEGSAFMNMRTMEPPHGRFSADFPLATYITFAYKLSLTPDQMQTMLDHLPNWVKSQRFTIHAKAEGNPTKDQMRLMMQSLLADRFHLATHFETRETAVLALVMIKPGKTGPKLLPHADGPPCDAPAPPLGGGSPQGSASIFPPACDIYGMRVNRDSTRVAASRNTTMARLAATIPSFGSVDRPVVDRTGLTGTWDLAIEFVPEPNGSAAADTNPRPPVQGPAFVDALREQLGLKLESAKAPIQTLVIDHVEPPSAN